MNAYLECLAARSDEELLETFGLEYLLGDKEPCAAKDVGKLEHRPSGG